VFLKTQGGWHRMSYGYDSHSGSVLEYYSGSYSSLSYSPYDSLRNALISFLSGTADRVYLSSSGSSGSVIKFIGDYPYMENIYYPTCVVAVLGESSDEYCGSFLYQVPTSSGSSGSMVWGETLHFAVRFDIWARSAWERDVVAGQVRNLLMWGMSPATNVLYSKGIRNIKIISSEVIGFDQSDRIIKEVDHRDMTSKIFRRGIWAKVTADIIYKPPIGQEEEIAWAEDIVLRTYISSGSEASYDILSSSGSLSE